jgi:hypothetical protein
MNEGGEGHPVERHPDLDEVDPGAEGSARDSQGPMGGFQSEKGTWLSGDEEDDPLREEAAERARRAVEPVEPRE